jgi:hypothetical protein
MAQMADCELDGIMFAQKSTKTSLAASMGIYFPRQTGRNPTSTAIGQICRTCDCD